ncbi:IS200/IS605 family transposase [Ligilactobacillus sp.]|uniref:IS200/IS605 family transposase n=1 Tax=Ligilactobacillus sp. TaxID=2767921 RepID=UPI002FDF7CF2
MNHNLHRYGRFTQTAVVVRAVKGRSAFILLKRHPEIRQSQYWGGHLWSPGYYMSTLGNMSKDVVENYINNQKYNALQKKKHPY